MSKLTVIVFVVTTISLTFTQPFFGPSSNEETDKNIIDSAEAFKRIQNSFSYFEDHVHDESVIEILKKLRLVEVKNILKSISEYKDVNGNIQLYSESANRLNRFVRLTSVIMRSGPLDSTDRLATESEINYILRNHHPFSDEEKKILDEEINTESERKSDSYDKDIDPDFHNAKERKHYRPFIKKYSIIDPKLIQPLLEARYKLLKKNLIGKRISDLRNLEKILYKERLLAQIKSWNRNKIIKDPGDVYNFKLIVDDYNYREYLNLYGEYYQGNVLYGYKNRYDNPESHGYGFEITASKIIGKRFVMMHELFDELNQFNVYYKSLSEPNPKDLPLIEYLIESFRMLTFEYPQSRFKAKQWSGRSSETDQFGMFMVRPRHFKSKNPDEIYNRVDDDISIAKAKVARNLMINKKPNSLKIQKSLLNNHQYVRKIGITSSINFMDAELKKNRYQLALEGKKKLLTSMKKTSSLLLDDQSEFGIDRETLFHEYGDESHSRHKSGTTNIDTEVNQIVAIVKDSFNSNSNPIIEKKEHFEQKYDSIEVASSSGMNKKISNFGNGAGDDGGSSKRFYTSSQSLHTPEKRKKFKHI